MKKRINLCFFIIGCLSIILMAIFSTMAFYNIFIDQVKDNLRIHSSLLAETYSQEENKDVLLDYALNGLRITLIDPKGNVLLESDAPGATIENHYNRPEIRRALDMGQGEAVRKSDIVGSNTYYYALKLADGNILRLARAEDNILAVFWGLLPNMILIMLGVMILCLFIARALSKSIIAPIEKMAENMDSLEKCPAYEELIPFARTIGRQREKINQQLEKLEEEKNKIQTLIANMPEGFLLLDKNKDILLLNDSLISLLNHKPGFYLGKNILSLSRNEKLNDCLAKAVEGQKQIMDMNINNRQWQLLADPIYNNDKFLGVLCLILDITERKEMDQIKQEFTSNVSHELKTPLTSILGYAEMIDQGIAKPEDIRLFANKIHQEAERLLTLIGDIIRLSQLDEMNMEIDKEEINLYAIAQECLDNLTVYAKKRQVKLSLTGEDCCILANKMMMEELIYNICDNAIRYNKLGGEVHLQIYQRSAELVINLKDTGVGIAPEHQKRIFERFYRVDKSHSKETGGTGLGLAIVKHIVERQQGHLSLFSREGLGTEIEIIF